MLFDMSCTSVYRFWMQNVHVPLDMIFLSEASVVVGIVHQAAPMDPTLRGVAAPSRYVLEVPGGWCVRNGVRAGQRAEIVSAPR
jgi:uncharacterized protein